VFVSSLNKSFQPLEKQTYKQICDDDADEDEEENEEDLSRYVTAFGLDCLPNEILLQLEFANHHHKNLQAWKFILFKLVSY